MLAKLSWPDTDAQWERFLRVTGLTEDTAAKAVELGYWAAHYGVPGLTIVSGKRDPEWTKAAQIRWDRGNRAGLIARPATNSDHHSGRAFDFGIENGRLTEAQFDLVGRIGEALGLTWGGRFRGAQKRDPVHFSLR